jgi:hypothetical protein
MLLLLSLNRRNCVESRQRPIADNVPLTQTRFPLAAIQTLSQCNPDAQALLRIWISAMSGTRRAVRRWRARATRAKETLAKAETMSDADAREMMRAVAASYERLVERLEKEAAEA